MAEQDVVRDEIRRLETAYNRVLTEEAIAKQEERKIKSAFKGIKKWKGNVYQKIKDNDLKEKYSSWIWQFGFRDDGSIDGVADRLNKEIGQKEGLLESILASLENLVN